MDTRKLEQFKIFCDNAFKVGGLKDNTVDLVSRVARNLVEMHMQEFYEKMRQKELMEERIRLEDEIAMTYARLDYAVKNAPHMYPLTEKECRIPSYHAYYGIIPYSLPITGKEFLHFDLEP